MTAIFCLFMAYWFVIFFDFDTKTLNKNAWVLAICISFVITIVVNIILAVGVM